MSNEDGPDNDNPHGLTLADISFHVPIDAHDVVEALGNNDGLILSFILEMLERAGSSELKEDLLERLSDELEGRDNETEGTE